MDIKIFLWQSEHLISLYRCWWKISLERCQSDPTQWLMLKYPLNQVVTESPSNISSERSTQPDGLQISLIYWWRRSLQSGWHQISRKSCQQKISSARGSTNLHTNITIERSPKPGGHWISQKIASERSLQPCRHQISIIHWWWKISYQLDTKSQSVIDGCWLVHLPWYKLKGCPSDILVDCDTWRAGEAQAWGTLTSCLDQD